MSFSGGTFSINSSGQPVVLGTTITSTAFNALTADLATGLSTCILKDGTQTLTANIPMGGFKLTGLAAGSASGNSLRYEQVNGLITTAGDMLQGSGAGALVRLALGAAGTRLHSTGTAAEWQGTWFKAGSISRNIATATGSVAYTGVGFKPKMLIFIASVDQTSRFSIGLDDGAGASFCAYDNYQVSANTYGNVSNASILQLSGNTPDYSYFTGTSMDADGFTGTWTKVNGPTGTATCFYLALR